MASHTPTYRFGPYELRTRTREFYKYGTKLKLRPQPFRVLQILVEHAGDVVTREELHDALWPETTFVDFEHGLNNSIKELRRVLNDSPSEPRYIETLPRLGYRIIVPVETSDLRTVNESVSAFPVAAAEPDRPAEIKEAGVDRLRPFPRWTLGIGLGFLALMIVAGYLTGWHLPVRSSEASGRVMLAVLPFENLTGDAGQEYLGDGVTEELISQLGQTDPRHLGVIARTSVMHYKNSREPLQEIGRALQVQYALEGSVRRAPGRLRITAQLVDMQGQTLWSREYDRDASDLLAIQGEIAREISDEIRFKLGGSEPAVLRKTPPANPATNQAHDLYLRGTYFLNKRNVSGLQQAVSYFQQAIAKDPGYATAYAALANSYALLGGYSGGLQTQYMPKAREAALRAVELDGNLPEAHVALALIAQNYDWDWQTAEKEYRQAIQLNPNYATAHHWYAEHLALMGRFDEAFAESEKARQIDPLSMIIAADKGVILYYARQYDDSIKQFDAVQEMEPTFLRVGMIVYPQVEKELYPEALHSLEHEHQVDGESAWHWARLAYVYGRSGRKRQALQALEKVKGLNQRQPLDPGVLLWANLGTGDREQVFFWMEKAYSQHSNILSMLKVDPAFDSLRGDPRFQSMLHRVRLA